MRVFEWLVILVECKIYGIKELEASESKKSFVRLMIIVIQKIYIKVTRRKTRFRSFDTILKICLRLFFFKSRTSLFGCL